MIKLKLSKSSEVRDWKVESDAEAKLKPWCISLQITLQVKAATLVLWISETIHIYIYFPFQFEAQTIWGFESLLKDLELHYKIATISNFIEGWKPTFSSDDKLLSV